MPVAYVFQLGQSGIYKVGKADSVAKRRSTYETISTEALILYAQIETSNTSAVETFIKHRLQSHRWLEGAGSELYKPPMSYLDEVLRAANQWNDRMLPKLAEAARLTKLADDGRVLKPSDAARELFVELLQWRQEELRAQQEMTRISTELKLLMQTASEIEGIAVWKNRACTSLDTSRLKKERPDIHDTYCTRVTYTRPFAPRW